MKNKTFKFSRKTLESELLKRDAEIIKLSEELELKRVHIGQLYHELYSIPARLGWIAFALFITTGILIGSLFKLF